MRDLLTDKETAKILGKRITTLYKTIAFFDQHQDDQWELIEGEHFEFVTQSGEERRRHFYEEGVEALAEYYDKDTPNLVKAVSELLTQRRHRRKQMLVSRRITQELIESGSLVEVRGELGFVTRKTCINILQTNGKGINNSIERLIHAGGLEGQEGLILEQHFLKDANGEKIWSQKGISSIAIDMGSNSKINATRKAWVNAVGEVVEGCFRTEIKRLAAAPLNTQKAVDKAKRAAKYTCQVTGKRKTKAQNQELVLDGHHLFDKHKRPDLADLQDNILVVKSSIHSEFHAWQGCDGCEPKHFLQFVSEVRSDLFDSTSSRAMERFNKLTVKITRLQKNFENNHLRYR